jgi:release factor glutamine methyltransferase
MTTLVQAWTLARRALEAAGIDSPVIEARMLLLAATGLDRTTLITDPHRALPQGSAEVFQGFLDRRMTREPVAHIIGQRAFWTLDLKSDRRALVPRPETEVIVDMVLRSALADQPLRILDLGTGTGAILLALLAERPLWSGVGVDVSPDALALARENAALHGLEGRATLVLGNWADGIAERFDVVVSNPPYIPSEDIARLMADVRDHDPHLALDGGPDGLAPYRILVGALPRILTSGGMFAFEFGLGQGEDVRAIARASGQLVNLELVRDLTDRDRVLLGRLF